MIIACINCAKKFNVDSELIPNEGRTIQCGVCNHIWFFKKTDQIEEKLIKIRKINPDNFSKKKINQTRINKNSDKINNTKGSEIVMYKSQKNFTFSKFLSYLLVLIISFIAFVILLDTFKTPLFSIFPNLEFFLFNFYETLKDLILFVKDLR
tara:strand:+ start:449 stop:904 length:456 start_codon:yes stop_codon:yes gene_type:complete